MVNVVKVSPKKKKVKSEDERLNRALDYIKSLKKNKSKKSKVKIIEGEADWAKPKGIKKESFEQEAKIIEGEADWAKPKGIKKEKFDEDAITPLEKDNPDWANPKGIEEEDFGPVGELGVEDVEDKPLKVISQIRTGIKGLDNILDGGIPENNVVTVSGGPGSGKTIFCLQFIFKGAKNYNEPGVFISLEEEPERLIKTAKSFGWDYEEMIKQKKIVLIKSPLYKFQVLKNIIRENVYRIKAKRLVIDPGALFDLFFDREIEVRKALVELGSMLKKLGCTTIITTEEKGDARTFNQGDFSSDGIIFTYYNKIANQFMRMIAVIKMRGTSHSEKLHPLRFSSKGIEVLSEEEVFQDVAGSRF